jgi:hypothetical protein
MGKGTREEADVMTPPQGAAAWKQHREAYGSDDEKRCGAECTAVERRGPV